MNNKRVKVRELSPVYRIKNFDEVSLGYSEEEAVLESNRCLSCKNPKCKTSCPVNIDIPSFIREIKNKRFKEALGIIREKNFLSCVTGRVCPQENQCEGSCILSNIGEPISIGNLERFVSDLYLSENISEKQIIKKNHKVAVIGSGPAGLECAIECARFGYKVKIFEALHALGGVLSYGIPKFRLPEKIVNSEINKLKDLEIEVEMNVFFGRTFGIEYLRSLGYEAFFIGIGAGTPYFLNIKNENLQNIYSANEFLTRINLLKADNSNYDTPINIGDRAVVIGGGNVAIDSARVLCRLGSRVKLFYRRSRKDMPARKAEIIHAMEEGIEFNYLKEPLEFLEKDGKVSGVVFQNMRELEKIDSKGKHEIIKVDGDIIKEDCDIVIIAIGQGSNTFLASDLGLELNNKKHIVVDSETFETNIRGVFAGGDVISGAATVISAMGAGKIAAKNIDKYLKSIS